MLFPLSKIIAVGSSLGTINSQTIVLDHVCSTRYLLTLVDKALNPIRKHANSYNIHAISPMDIYCHENSHHNP